VASVQKATVPLAAKLGTVSAWPLAMPMTDAAMVAIMAMAEVFKFIVFPFVYRC
jgi:hypothetical protein